MTSWWSLAERFDADLARNFPGDEFCSREARLHDLKNGFLSMLNDEEDTSSLSAEEDFSQVMLDNASSKT
jgi:hypothetical protein